MFALLWSLRGNWDRSNHPELIWWSSLGLDLALFCFVLILVYWTTH